MGLGLLVRRLEGRSLGCWVKGVVRRGEWMHSWEQMILRIRSLLVGQAEFWGEVGYRCSNHC